MGRLTNIDHPQDHIAKNTNPKGSPFSGLPLSFPWLVSAEALKTQEIRHPARTRLRCAKLAQSAEPFQAWPQVAAANYLIFVIPAQPPATCTLDNEALTMSASLSLHDDTSQPNRESSAPPLEIHSAIKAVFTSVDTFMFSYPLLPWNRPLFD